jgi:DNA modification methylase
VEPDWDELTELYGRVLTENGLFVLFGQQPSLIPAYQSFTNDGFQFRYELIWEKKNPSWVSSYQPLPAHETIFIFARSGVKAGETVFNTDQVMEDASFVCSNCEEDISRGSYEVKQGTNSQSHKGAQTSGAVSSGGDERYPKSVLEYEEVHPQFTDDPKSAVVGQKPWRLIRWLIAALSERKPNGSATVLDPHMGSGTTPAVAIPLCRKSIGIEADYTHKAEAQERIDAWVEQLEGSKHAIVRQQNQKVAAGDD